MPPFPIRNAIVLQGSQRCDLTTVILQTLAFKDFLSCGSYRILTFELLERWLPHNRVQFQDERVRHVPSFNLPEPKIDHQAKQIKQPHETSLISITMRLPERTAIKLDFFSVYAMTLFYNWSNMEWTLLYFEVSYKFDCTNIFLFQYSSNKKN